ncbi:leucine-rich repeat protein [uncultured Ruminococcus sp.]|uniref:leucine-rich repeat protein n=1 Tax=uncultured Ruminococcus sp. TaxID=165186 RepID=UPI00261FD49C|nr:leucine-rich repeat protein [uncultured Ruminococcus sp.]
MKGFISALTALTLIGGTAYPAFPVPAAIAAETPVIPSDRDFSLEDIDPDLPVIRLEDDQFFYGLYDGFAILNGVKEGTRTMEELTIPETIRDLPVIALFDTPLADCKSLKKLTLSKNIRFLTRDDYYCDNLEEVIIPEDNPYYTVSDNMIFSKDMRTLVGAVSAEALTELNIPEETEIIGDYAFASCCALTEADIPDHVTEVGAGAFAGCQRLQKVTLSKDMKFIMAHTFYGCERLAEVDFHSTGSNMPPALWEIGAGAFENCVNLQNFYIPGFVSSVRMNAFKNAGCVQVIDGIHYVGNWAVGTDPDIQRGDIIEGTTGTCEALFSDNKELKVITVPKTVSCMGRLLVATIDNHVERVDFYGSIIGYNALAACKHLKMVCIYDRQCRIADSARTIPQYWTEDIPEDELYISGIDGEPTEESEKFNTVIYGSDNSTALRYAAAYNREFSLTDNEEYKYEYSNDPNFDLRTKAVQKEQDGIIYNVFGDYAVAEERVDPQQKDVVIANKIGDINVTEVSPAFSFRGEVPVEKLRISDNAQYNEEDNRALYLDSLVVTNYCSYFETGEDSRNLTASDGILYTKDMTTLVSCPRYYDQKEVTVPDGVFTIGCNAFLGCENIEKVILPATVTVIDAGAFRGMKNLKTIVFPNNLRIIGTSAFENCTELQQVTFSNYPDDIYPRAFYGCTNAYEAEDGIQYIGDIAVGIVKNTKELSFRKDTKKIAMLDFSEALIKKATIPAGAELSSYLSLNDNCNIETLYLFSADGKCSFANLDHLKDIYIYDRSFTPRDDFRSNFPTLYVENKYPYNSKPDVRYIEILPYGGRNTMTSSSGLYLDDLPGDEFYSAAGPAIHGYSGSPAELGAIDNNIRFIPLEDGTSEPGTEHLVTGDINGDNRLNIGDYVLLSRYLRGRTKLTEEQAAFADINGDGEIDIFDMVALRKMFFA